MNVTVIKVKKYNATYNHVVCVDSIPICIAESSNRASKIVSYLCGYDDVDIKDGTIKKKLDKVMNK